MQPGPTTQFSPTTTFGPKTADGSTLALGWIMTSPIMPGPEAANFSVFLSL